MKELKNKLFKTLWGRTGRNIIFWVIFLGFWWLNFKMPTDYPPRYYLFFIFLFQFWMFLLTYFNSFFLIPKFLARKKYWQYIFSAVAFSYLIGFIIALSFNIMMHKFPKMHIGQVSFITTDVPVSYTWPDLHTGARNYFFFMLEWICVFNMAWYMNDYARQQRIIEANKKKQLETELSFLKGQMHPHFLFNTLNNLYGLALRKSENTPNAILKLSSILRYLLYDSEVETVSFENEKEVMLAYIELELLRLQDADNLNFNISADGPYQLPPLLWLPVLENIFKHGTRIIADSYCIDYRFEILNNNLTISSKNNYKSVSNGETADNPGGIGLENLKKRLSLLYPGKYSFNTSHDEQYFYTELKINLG